MVDIKYRKIPVPGEENMTPEELKKERLRLKMLRYREKKRLEKRQKEADDEKERLKKEIADGKYDKKEDYVPRLVRLSKQEIRIIDNSELVALTADTRNLMMMVLNEKAKSLLGDPEELKKLNMTSIATAFGILVDKHNIMNGMATENIAIHHKIDINMSSDKALEELNKMREKYAESNS